MAKPTHIDLTYHREDGQAVVLATFCIATGYRGLDSDMETNAAIALEDLHSEWENKSMFSLVHR